MIVIKFRQKKEGGIVGIDKTAAEGFTASGTGRDTIPVYLISRTCILVRRLRSYQIRTRFLLRRKIFSAWENQSIRLNG